MSLCVRVCVDVGIFCEEMSTGGGHKYILYIYIVC